jgi:predicted nicotinamide N-methyase
MPTLAGDTLRRRNIPGGWAEQEFNCAGHNWSVLLPADADEFLNELDSRSPANEPDVYWAKLWPPAMTMSSLISQFKRPGTTTALELGCGIGIVGLAALAAGWQLTFSDYVPMAVEVALANAERNGYSAVRGFVLDWKQPTSEQFDVLLGSDILYDKNNHAPLVNVLETMMRPDGIAWIGDAGRYHVSSFIELAWQRGFDVELRDEHGQRLTSPTSAKFQLLELRRI